MLGPVRHTPLMVTVSPTSPVDGVTDVIRGRVADVQSSCANAAQRKPDQSSARIMLVVCWCAVLDFKVVSLSFFFRRYQ
jgi:hypothetical protein